MTTDTTAPLGRWARLKSRWPLLNNAQKFYTVSCLLALLNFVSAFQVEFLLTLLGFCVVTALIIDIWNVFEHLWHKLAGKTFLIAIYLGLANYCYALSQSQVNSLIGIRADLVPHSVHLNLFLMAPLWSFGLAFVVLVFYTSYHTIKGFLMLLLRPIGVRSHHLSDEVHPVLFLVIRIFMLPVVIVYLGIAMSGYIVGGDLTDTDVNLIDGQHGAPLRIETKLAPTEQSAATPDNTAHAERKSVTLFGQPTSQDPLSYLATPNLPWIDHIVAGFLYHVESMGRSNCQQQGDEHVVYINDYEILVITPNNSEKSGYQFTIRACNSKFVPKVQVINP